MNKAKHLINELLVEIFNHILSIEEEEIKKLDINLSLNEIHTLESIENTEYPTMSNVSKKLRITISTLTTTINRLVKKGYVERYFNEEDRRKVYLKLTNESIEVLKKHELFHNELIDSIFKDIPLEEDEVLLKSLQNISNYFKEKY